MTPSARAIPWAGRGQDGFSLVEVLVALAVASALIAAIGALAASNRRAMLALERRTALLETARAIETGIPPRNALAIGRIEGEVAGHGWRMEVSPFAVEGMPEGSPWMPVEVKVAVRSPAGGTLVLDTVRLVRSAPP